jgi:hypothetical protein
MPPKRRPSSAATRQVADGLLVVQDGLGECVRAGHEGCEGGTIDSFKSSIPQKIPAACSAFKARRSRRPSRPCVDGTICRTAVPLQPAGALTRGRCPQVAVVTALDSGRPSPRSVRPRRGLARAHSRPVSDRRVAVPGGGREHSGRESLGAHIPPPRKSHTPTLFQLI